MLVSSISNVNYAYLKKSNNNATPIASSFKNDVPTDNPISFKGLFSKPPVSTKQAIQELRSMKKDGMYAKIGDVFKFIPIKKLEKMEKGANFENISELVIKKTRSLVVGAAADKVTFKEGFSPSMVMLFSGKNLPKLTNVTMLVDNGYHYRLSLPADTKLKEKALESFKKNEEIIKLESKLLYIEDAQQNVNQGFLLANTMVNDAKTEGLTLRYFYTK